MTMPGLTDRSKLDGFGLKIEGMNEFLVTLDHMLKGVSPGKVEPVLKQGANIMAKEAKSRAPVRKQDRHKGDAMWARKAPGILKRSIKTKQLNRYFGQPAPSIAAIDRHSANHAWLVVHGTKGKRVVSPPRWVVIAGRPAIIDNTGVMPKNTFWGDAIRSKQSQVLNLVADAVGKNLEEAMK